MSYRSKKNREFAKIKRKYLENHPYCEIHLQLGMQIPATDVHHIKARWHGDNSSENLVAVCRQCHQAIHGQYGSLEYQTKIKRILNKIKEVKK